MGGFISRIQRLFTRTTNMRVLMNGLDAAGKTTILYKLKLGEVVTTIPTIGFNVESIEHRNVSFTVWDVGGRDKIRPLYRHYYQGTDALIFVVDSNDAERLDDRNGYDNSAREEIHRAMAADELRNAPLLVFANKQDLPNALSTSEITQRLGLAQLRGREWLLQGCCATSGDGLYEGLDWLSEAVKRKGSIKRVAEKPAPAAAPAPRAVVAAPPAPVRPIMDAISSDNPHVFAVKAIEPLVLVPPAAPLPVPVAPALAEPAPRVKHSPTLRKRTPSQAAPAIASTPAFQRELQSSPLVLLSQKSAAVNDEALSAASKTEAGDPESRSSSSSSSSGAVTPAETLFGEGEGESDFVVVERVQQAEQPGATVGLDQEGAGETEGLVWLDSHGEEMRRRNDRPVALRVAH